MQRRRATRVDAVAETRSRPRRRGDDLQTVAGILAPPAFQKLATAVRRTRLVHNDRRRGFAGSQGVGQRTKRFSQQRQTVERIDDGHQFHRGIGDGRCRICRGHVRATCSTTRSLAASGDPLFCAWLARAPTVCSHPETPRSRGHPLPIFRLLGLSPLSQRPCGARPGLRGHRRVRRRASRAPGGHRTRRG